MELPGVSEHRDGASGMPGRRAPDLPCPCVLFTSLLLLLATVLVLVGLLHHWVEDWFVSTAMIYLAAGAAAGALGGGLPFEPLDADMAAPLLVVTETVVLVSLFTVGLRLRRLPTPAWRLAIRLASSGMLLTIALVGLLAWWLLELPWAAALVLATVLAPTDPVLASEVQVRSPGDRDAVRLSLTAEGGLNDGTALPVMLLALGAVGLHPLGPWGLRWLALDLLWSIGGGLALGWLLGRGLDRLLRRLLAAGHALAWDELLYAGVIALCYGLARLSSTSDFLVVFMAGVALFWRGQRAPPEDPAPLDARLVAFGARCERLLEVFMVLALGAALAGLGPPSLATLLFALLVLLLLRPLAVLAVVRPRELPVSQRWLLAWFGVRGVGSLFYLLFALRHGLPPSWVEPLVSACLWTLGLSILLHGVSATPLMNWHHEGGGAASGVDGPGAANAAVAGPASPPEPP